MKRVGGLWPVLTSFANLLAAAEAAGAGKRKRADVAAFRMNLEPELMQLRRELVEGSYRPGRYRTFTILDPKPRQISAAPFRDRVVHHALTRMLEPVFERRFSRNWFACRAGMGTHKALARAREGTRKFAYVLKCDNLRARSSASRLWIWRRGSSPARIPRKKRSSTSRATTFSRPSPGDEGCPWGTRRRSFSRTSIWVGWTG